MAKKPPTQEQRDRKNAALRAKRAAQAEARKAETKAINEDLKRVMPGKPVAPPKMALDAAPVSTRGQDKGGRRAIYGEKMHTVSFKCTREQHATFLKAGGNVYLRARLDELTAYYARGGK